MTEKAATIAAITGMTFTLEGELNAHPYGRAATSVLVSLTAGLYNVTVDSFKKSKDSVGEVEILSAEIK